MNTKATETPKKERKYTGEIVFASGKGNTMPITFLPVRPDIEFFANDVQLNSLTEATERFVPISSEPAMPVIRISNNLNEEIKGRLKIEYTKNSNGQVVRKWLNHYPAEEDEIAQVETIGANSSWIVDFGDHIRGGKATFEYVIGDNEWCEEDVETFVFYLRCRNPDREEVITYLEEEGYDEQYWFLIRLIRHESATRDADEFRQFNIGTNYTTTNLSGLPNFGAPRGYGLGQIDNFGRLTNTERNELSLSDLEAGETIVDDEERTIDRRGYIVASDDQVWNWKENIGAIISILDTKKETIINKYNQWTAIANEWNEANPNDLVEHHADQVEGDITFGSVESNIAGIPNNINEYFAVVEEEENTEDVENPGAEENPEGVENPANPVEAEGAENAEDNEDAAAVDTRSFIDACLIRYYNGGYYHRLRRNGTQKPYWDIDRDSEQSGFYVEHICSQDE